MRFIVDARQDGGFLLTSLASLTWHYARPYYYSNATLRYLILHSQIQRPSLYDDTLL